MINLVPLEEHNVNNPLNPKKLRRVVVRDTDAERLNNAFRDFYSDTFEKERNEEGWLSDGLKYSLSGFLERKANAAKILAAEGKSKVPVFLS